MENFDITAHMVVKNEEQWVWYSIVSVLPYVKRILIYDTGSTDNTVKIIQSIHSPKIHFTAFSAVAAEKLVLLRNIHIEETNSEWFMLLDGDEVWTDISLVKLLTALKKCSQDKMAVVCKTIFPVGDLFHLQPDTAGKYQIGDLVGHYNIRFYRKSMEFNWRGTYPLEAYTNSYGEKIQEMGNLLEFVDCDYWHMTHLKRSSVDTHHRRKFEIGRKHDSVLPNVFFETHPEIVPSPYITFSAWEYVFAYIATPLLKIKRRIIKL